MRSLGYGTVISHIPDSIARGSAALVTLHEGLENEAILKRKVAAWYSFNKRSSSQDYPTSLMGAIALLHHTYPDADWYKKGGSAKEQNLSLEDLINCKLYPTFLKLLINQMCFRQIN